jgi:hypothetical protein
LLAGLILLGVEIQIFGLGVRIPNQDPEAIGRANAFAATARSADFRLLKTVVGAVKSWWCEP